MGNAGLLDKETLAKLAKILALTQSDHDGEALVAVRKAGAILRRHGINFNDLLQNHGTSSQLALEERLERARLELAEERQRSASLSAALDQALAKTEPTQKRPLFGSLEQLRRYMMNHLSLQSYERHLLERVVNPTPRSKEAHIILICARRYGVHV